MKQRLQLRKMLAISIKIGLLFFLLFNLVSTTISLRSHASFEKVRGKTFAKFEHQHVSPYPFDFHQSMEPFSISRR